VFRDGVDGLLLIVQKGKFTFEVGDSLNIGWHSTFGMGLVQQVRPASRSSDNPDEVIVRIRFASLPDSDMRQPHNRQPSSA